MFLNVFKGQGNLIAIYNRTWSFCHECHINERMFFFSRFEGLQDCSDEMLRDALKRILVIKISKILRFFFSFSFLFLEGVGLKDIIKIKLKYFNNIFGIIHI